MPFPTAVFAATQSDGARYTWSADLTGAADGTLNYHVCGVANEDSTEVRRAGLNILYANECVLGQPFETTHLDGKIMSHTFPELVPAHHLPATDFSKISHRPRGGALVTAEISGSHFGLEDQRVAGDSSFKAFARPAPHLCPCARKRRRCSTSCDSTLDFDLLASRSTTVSP